MKTGKGDSIHITSEVWYFGQASYPQKEENYYHGKISYYSVGNIHQLLKVIFFKSKNYWTEASEKKLKKAIVWSLV